MKNGNKQPILSKITQAAVLFFQYYKQTASYKYRTDITD
jgi:hypothetical protein